LVATLKVTIYKMAKRGFLPCFSNYKYSHFPVEKLYLDDTHVIKVKNLISALIDSESLLELKSKGVGADIQPVRPNSKEGKRLVNLFGYEKNLFRVDYGKSAFKIIFGLSNDDRMAFFFAFDIDHSTFKVSSAKR